MPRGPFSPRVPGLPSFCLGFLPSSRGSQEVGMATMHEPVIASLAACFGPGPGPAGNRGTQRPCLIMDPTEILNVRFHIGGEFVGIGPNFQYVGGDEEMSEIERDKLSLHEVKGFLNDHMHLKESMKLYFQVPGKSMADGSMFLHDDRACLQKGEYTDVGGVAHIFVEYHGEKESENSSSGSDFEMDEMVNLSDADEPAIVISAEPAAFSDDDDVQFVQEVLVPNDSGVITQIISSPVKHIHVDARARRVGAQQVAEEQVPAQQVQDVVDGSQFAISQVLNPAAHASGHGTETPSEAQPADSDSDSDSHPEYLAHSEDNGENSEVPGQSSSAPAHTAPSGRGSSAAPRGRDHLLHLQEGDHLLHLQEGDLVHLSLQEAPLQMHMLEHLLVLQQRREREFPHHLFPALSTSIAVAMCNLFLFANVVVAITF
ncbi:hypothetical protein D1007_59268 [Hordeum vulgare]|nr:hypothetical protein D1007_59268 [Hordeum vulgare]